MIVSDKRNCFIRQILHRPSSSTGSMYALIYVSTTISVATFFVSAMTIRGHGDISTIWSPNYEHRLNQPDTRNHVTVINHKIAPSAMTFAGAVDKVARRRTGDESAINGAELDDLRNGFRCDVYPQKHLLKRLKRWKISNSVRWKKTFNRTRMCITDCAFCTIMYGSNVYSGSRCANVCVLSGGASDDPDCAHTTFWEIKPTISSL